MQAIVIASVAIVSYLAGAACFDIQFSQGLELVSNEPFKFKCVEEGRFPHPFKCDGYVECVPNSQHGDFKRRSGSCHGATFNAKSKSCIETDESYKCKGQSFRFARSLTPALGYSDLCSKTPNGFVCADCKTTVNCVEGVAYPETCTASSMCSNMPKFGGAVCYPTPLEQCSCNASNAFFMDPYNNQTFFFCNEAGGEPELYHCPRGMVFDKVSEQCFNRDNLPQCLETGVFASYDNCSQYYTCIASKDGWVQKSFRCESNLMYNEDAGVCEDPCRWDTGVFTCQVEGRFADPLSCQHFYQCIQLGDTFRQDRYQCPRGFDWEPTELGIGYCTDADLSICKTVQVNKCTIPEGLCIAGTQPDATQPGPSFRAIVSNTPSTRGNRRA